VLSVVGIPERINQVIALPGATTLETIMNAIKQ
jgi:Trm5-related predicted tRNA methylase